MVTVVLPGQLRDINGGASTLVVDPAGGTVGGLLQEIRVRNPAVYDHICTEGRVVRPHVNVFVGTENIRWSGGLDTPVPDGSEVVILPSVSGG